MKRGDIPYYQNDDDAEDSNCDGPRPNFNNYRWINPTAYTGNINPSTEEPDSGESYNNSYEEYKGGYGPMNSSSFRPMHNVAFAPRNSGGVGPRNSGGFGPMNSGGFRHMNSNNFGVSNLTGTPGNFGTGIRSLFAPREPHTFDFRGPPKIRKDNVKSFLAFKYLLRCGIPKEHIKDVPASILELMEPEQCGVCALQFNSDAVARTHYLSKNHQKNQKKWLTRHKDGGFSQSKEIPFKSRELYCELCNVHITSKSHADSHYAGKTHLAIVEGRKLPRNAMLLQRGMEFRLDQLIRREKKNMKHIDDADKKDRAREPRPFQPELYCKICKTSVTCSEQMTMHLNGKRHLSKEKQHILKTMKGENIDDKEEQNENAGEYDEEDSENEEDKTEDGDVDETKDEDDDYDWGDGSSTWDEPECL